MQIALEASVCMQSLVNTIRLLRCTDPHVKAEAMDVLGANILHVGWQRVVWWRKVTVRLHRSHVMRMILRMAVRTILAYSRLVIDGRTPFGAYCRHMRAGALSGLFTDKAFPWRMIGC